MGFQSQHSMSVCLRERRRMTKRKHIGLWCWCSGHCQWLCCEAWDTAMSTETITPRYPIRFVIPTWWPQNSVFFLETFHLFIYMIRSCSSYRNFISYREFHTQRTFAITSLRILFPWNFYLLERSNFALTRTEIYCLFCSNFWFFARFFFTVWNGPPHSYTRHVVVEAKWPLAVILNAIKCDSTNRKSHLKFSSNCSGAAGLRDRSMTTRPQSMHKNTKL